MAINPGDSLNSVPAPKKQKLMEIERWQDS